MKMNGRDEELIYFESRVGHAFPSRDLPEWIDKAGKNPIRTLTLHYNKIKRLISEFKFSES